MNASTPHISLTDILSGRAILLEDGGMGTMVQQTGLLNPGDAPELLNLKAPEAVTAIHRAYVDSGSMMVTANTFGASALKLSKIKAPEYKNDLTVENIFDIAIACARAANPNFIAASIGPLGELLEPYGDLEHEEAYDLFAQQIKAASKAGCDIIAVETMSDIEEAQLAIKAAREFSDIPVFATMSFTASGHTIMGTTPKDAALALASFGADAVGLNCSVGPIEAATFAAEMKAAVDLPIIVKPNAGLPHIENNKTYYDVTDEDFAEAMRISLDNGATIIGGCCGTTPEYIEKLKRLIG